MIEMLDLIGFVLILCTLMVCVTVVICVNIWKGGNDD
jgi:hypothetical protein